MKLLSLLRGYFYILNIVLWKKVKHEQAWGLWNLLSFHVWLWASMKCMDCRFDVKWKWFDKIKLLLLYPWAVLYSINLEITVLYCCGFPLCWSVNIHKEGKFVHNDGEMHHSSHWNGTLERWAFSCVGGVFSLQLINSSTSKNYNKPFHLQRIQRTFIWPCVLQLPAKQWMY